MYTLLADNVCNESTVLRVIYLIKNVIDVIKVLVPVILIVLGILDITKAVMASDERKMDEYKQKFIRRTISAVIIFFVPAVVDFCFYSIDGLDLKYTECWTTATSENILKFKTEEDTARNAQEQAEAAKKAAETAFNSSNNLGTTGGSGSSGGTGSSGGSSSSSGSSSSGSSSSSNKTNSKDTKRAEVVKYALKFVGHPYVYGGTKLCTNWKKTSGCGVDCSAFVQNVYKHFKYSLPRVAADQANYSKGKKILASNFGKNYKNLKPGDLLFYKNGSNGTIGHVTIYAGNGQVVHASNSRTGVITSKMNYRYPGPVWAVRIIK